MYEAVMNRLAYEETMNVGTEKILTNIIETTRCVCCRRKMPKRIENYGLCDNCLTKKWGVGKR